MPSVSFCQYTWKRKAISIMKKTTVKSNASNMYFVNSTTQRAIDHAVYDYNMAREAGVLSGKNEHAIVMALFSNYALPTFKEFQDTFKAWREALPKDHTDKKLAIPTRHSAGYGSMYQVFNNAAKVREAQDNGFNALSYWNDFAKTKTRETEPNLSALLKGARAYLKGTDSETAPEYKAVKYFKTTYNALQNCKGKSWQDASEKLAAIMTSLKIEIPQPAND